jgi:mycothiol synthase
MRPTDTATVELTLPDAPAIPGLRFRRFHDASDWAPLADLQKAVAIADQDDEIQSPENLRIEVENKPGFQMERDMVIAEVDGRVIGSADGTATIRDGYPVHSLWGRVHPDWRRRGIGRALFRWNERRARERAAAESDFAGPRAVFATWASEFEPGAQRLYAAEGYQVVRYAFTMIQRHVQQATPVPMPDGLEIRPVTPEQHRAIFDADDEAFLDHFEHRPATEGDFVAIFTQPDLDTSLWQVGWDGDEVAGSVQTWIWKEENETLGTKRAWLESVSVRRPWRRRGLGRALIAASLVDLRRRDIEEALLGVDAENPTGALALYEDLGFEVKVRAMRYRKALET